MASRALKIIEADTNRQTCGEWECGHDRTSESDKLTADFNLYKLTGFARLGGSATSSRLAIF